MVGGVWHERRVGDMEKKNKMAEIAWTALSRDFNRRKIISGFCISFSIMQRGQHLYD